MVCEGFGGVELAGSDGYEGSTIVLVGLSGGVEWLTRQEKTPVASRSITKRPSDQPRTRTRAVTRTRRAIPHAELHAE